MQQKGLLQGQNQCQHQSHSPFSKGYSIGQIQSPSSKINKQNLIDQIISNCKRAQSPAMRSPRKSPHSVTKVSNSEEVFYTQSSTQSKENVKSKAYGAESWIHENKDSRIQLSNRNVQYFPFQKPKGLHKVGSPKSQACTQSSRKVLQNVQNLHNCQNMQNGHVVDQGQNFHKMKSLHSVSPVGKDSTSDRYKAIREAHLEHCKKE